MRKFDLEVQDLEEDIKTRQHLLSNFEGSDEELEIVFEIRGTHKNNVIDIVSEVRAPITKENGLVSSRVVAIK